MKIKICGLKDKAQAVKAAALGADLLGFVFAESRRRVSPETVASIIMELPENVSKAGVFVNEDLDVINDIVNYCGLDYVQLHGEESPEYCRKIKCPVIKGIKIKDSGSFRELVRYQDSVESCLLDSYRPGIPGGTGITFDWQMVAAAGKIGRFFLAGGLTPENVKDAISIARPYGVDVSGGVETNGIKDLKKMELFINTVRGI